MELSPRLLAFLEHEMKQIKDDRSRDGEDRTHAASVLGRIEEEIDHQEQMNAPDAQNVELFS
jgi:hypothetical protein